MYPEYMFSQSLHGCKWFKMMWTPTNSHGLKQSTWLRTDDSGSCWPTSGTPHSYTEVYAAVDDDDDGKVQYTVEMNTTHFKKLQSPNSWNRQVAYRQADGQNKLPTLSTN